MADWKSLTRHPLSAAYSDMSGPEWYGFCLDFKATGFLSDREIILHEGMILDGWQRFRACLETGIEPEFATLAEGIDPEAYVRAMNDRRRHENEAERIERRKRVAEAVARGDSKSSIAKEEQVSRKTIDNDLKKIEDATGHIPESPDGKVTGSDGKKQSAKKAQVLCRHCEHRKIVGKPLVENCPDCAELRKVLKPKPEKKEPKGVADSDAPLKDDAGVIVPQRLIPVFQSIPAFVEAEKALNAASRAFKVIEEGPCKDVKPIRGSDHYRKFYGTFKAARLRLKAMRPSLVCPNCEGEGCGGCGQQAKQDIDGKGWLTVEEAAEKTNKA